MRLFATDRVTGLMNTLGIDEDTPIDARILSNAVENAQKSVESRNFRARKNVLEYDNVMNTQREVIYDQRRKVLDGENLSQTVLNNLRRVVEGLVNTVTAELGAISNQDELKALLSRMDNIYFPTGTVSFTDAELSAMKPGDLSDALYEKAAESYALRESAFGERIMRELERVIMLRVVDEFWMDNIDAMDDLKQGIGLRAYAQHDPVIAYKEEGYEMFQAMIAAIREETVRRIFLVQLRTNQEVKRQKVAKETSAVGTADTVMKKQPVRKDKKAGPNDPCPCGSGKKYKKCCMQKDKSSGMEQ